MAKRRKTKHKITKHEMKEDKFVTSMMHGADYARENVQSVVIIVLVLLVLVAGVVIMKNLSSNRKKAAQTLLGVAQIAYRAGDFAESRDSLVALEERYPKSDAALVGAYLLGHIYYSSGSPDSAKIYWQRFIESEYKDEDMMLAAKAGLAGVLSDRGQFAEAAREFERLYSDYPDYFNRHDWLYKAAMNYRAAGERDKEKELLERFVGDYPKNPRVMEAKVFLAEIEET